MCFAVISTVLDARNISAGGVGNLGHRTRPAVDSWCNLRLFWLRVAEPHRRAQRVAPSLLGSVCAPSRSYLGASS